MFADRNYTTDSLRKKEILLFGFRLICLLQLISGDDLKVLIINTQGKLSEKTAALKSEALLLDYIKEKTKNLLKLVSEVILSLFTCCQCYKSFITSVFQFVDITTKNSTRIHKYYIKCAEMSVNLFRKFKNINF